MFTSELQQLLLMSAVETARLLACWKFYLKSRYDRFCQRCTRGNPAGIIFTFEMHDCVKPQCVLRLKVTQQPERCCAARRVVMWVTSACCVSVFVFSLLCVCVCVSVLHLLLFINPQDSISMNTEPRPQTLTVTAAGISSFNTLGDGSANSQGRKTQTRSDRNLKMKQKNR